MIGLRPIAIVGPTAGGKTALSIEVALRIGGEIISMDSRQVYRGMDIGTAKATAAQRARVPHFGLDLVDPDERFSAGEFGRRARGWIADIQSRGHVPMLVGGTGFFLRSLTHPIFAEPPLDPRRRDALRGWLSRLETAELHRWLGALDPPASERLQGWGGRQRLLRSLELPLLTGQTLAWWHARSPAEAEAVGIDVFVLNPAREQLDRAISERVERMAADGLVDEVKNLMSRGYDERDPGMNATGTIELLPVCRGEIPLEAGLERIRKHTRAYARRQLTWFRHQLPAGAVWLDANRSGAELAEEIAARRARRGEDTIASEGTE